MNNYGCKKTELDCHEFNAYKEIHTVHRSSSGSLRAVLFATSTGMANNNNKCAPCIFLLFNLSSVLTRLPLSPLLILTAPIDNLKLATVHCRIE